MPENTAPRRSAPQSAKPRTVVLTFDDCCRSHREVVVPILKQYGFGATFFICRFSDEWRRKNGAYLLSGREVKALSDQGFEIGNHTWSHPDLRRCSPGEIGREIVMLNDFLAENGVPSPVSFAYPGGPFAEGAVPLLKKHGLRAARTTECLPWEAKKHDPMQIPSFPLQHDDASAFFSALDGADEDHVPVLLFHGVPDIVHEWVNTSPEFFRKCMRYLADKGFRVISMRRHLEESGLL